MSYPYLAPKCIVSKLALVALLALLVFAVQPAQAQYTESVPYTFSGGSDGAAPVAGLIPDSAGNLYGTTVNGGDVSGSNCPGLNPPTGCGVVFKLSPPSGGTGPWTETVLYTFTGGSDGSYPQAGLIFFQGNLYGTASSGGSTAGDCAGLGGCGVVFELTPPSGGSGPWTETPIYTFTDGNDGALPYAGVIFDANGNLYSTAVGGGENGYGVVFELSPPSGGSGPWTETTLWAFTDHKDGGNPVAGLIFDASGNLYGTAFGGSDGFGVVFELSPLFGGGGAWTETLIYTFTEKKGDGANPYAGVIFDSKGNLYGTTSNGGSLAGDCKRTDGCGVVFELTPPSSGTGTWTENSIYAFSGGSDGGYPEAGVIFDSNGNLYGTTVEGGNTSGPNCSAASGCGVVFELTPPSSGTGPWTETVLYTFNGGSDGSSPYAGLIFNSGNLYGTAYGGGDLSGSNCSAVGGCGVVFELSPQVAPVVAFSPTSLTFGNQVVGTISPSKKVTATNTGSATLDIDSVTVSGEFKISSNTCGATLAVGKSCKVTITFDPTQLGPQTGTLNFNDNAPNSPQTVPLSGTGVGVVTLTPSSATYAKQKVGTTSKPKTFTLTNNQSVTLNSIVPSTTGDFQVSTTTCGTSLAAKANCTINVTFTPTETGTRTGQLSVSDNASNSPQTASLTGTGD